jgi:hypothetical protein
MLDDLKASPSDKLTPGAIAAIVDLKASFPAWAELALAHLRNEENTITAVIRKYTNIERQRALTRQVYGITSSENWHKVLPFVVNSVEVPTWKVRFVRTFIWAMPERAQEIGLIVYRGVDSVTWSFLAAEIPEMVPRGLHGYKRIY